MIWPLNRRHYLTTPAESVVPTTRRRRSGRLPDPDTVLGVVTQDLMTFHDIADRLGAGDDAEKGAISRALRRLVAAGCIERVSTIDDMGGHRRWAYRHS